MDQLIEFASNHVFLAGIWVALVVMLVFSFISGWTSPVKEVSTHEMTQLINKKDAVVLDTRPAKDFKTGHILGARQLGAEELRTRDFKKLEKFKAQPIIVVCAMGNSARAVAASLAKAGFSEVTILKGGMNAWQSAGLPVAK
ncbi:rhodanese-like domain-containing protein [Alteromonas aestuariivivens]|uniref:Rhodanese-like domain-containing protein n=1 Tax=Alteromonas aestuariivivens TaxID=1938339 RepID=A0A3D8M9I1_9ALTE|nr:rhodanese-like domain-containing protein [Alteromonas aestuariivivens]RDV26677.1 rhodanese-like domain-containing protein [Alteromonas aestuariivivens]